MNTSTRSNAARSTAYGLGSPKHRLGNTAVSACVAIVLFGSLYMGLASCGGRLWHQQTLYGASIALYVAALALPGTFLPSLKYKVLFAIGLPILAVVLTAAVAPFYPSQPKSVSEYWAIFVSALRFSACG